jgi:hypothetical protein
MRINTHLVFKLNIEIKIKIKKMINLISKIADLLLYHQGTVTFVAVFCFSGDEAI